MGGPTRRIARQTAHSAYLPRTGGLIGRAHPAVSGVAALTAAIQVGKFQLLKPVGSHGVAFGLHVDVVELRGVQPEDLGLVFFGELLVAELLAELVADLEPLERVNGPLRRPPPQTIGAPDDMIGAVIFDVLAYPVHAHFGMD